MAAPRTGSLGVAFAKGDIYVVDTNLQLERLAVGADGQVLTVDPTTNTGLKWENPDFVQNISLQCDAVDAIFEQINIGGAIANPAVTNRGTHAVLAFNDTTIQGIAWQRFVPIGYTTGSTLRVSIYWVSATAVVGDVVWAAAFERDQAAGHDIDSDDFAALQTAAASTAPGTSGVIQVATIDFTNAQADGVVAGNPFRLFVQRTANSGSDTMVGDAQIVRVVVEEIQP